MAKGKGKAKIVTASRMRKMHGPKRHLFKDFKPMIHKFGKLGLLDKYNNYESFALACAARGKKNTSKAEFAQFAIMSKAQQDEYFTSLRK